MVDGWLWHPNKAVDQVPLESDYRCCCGACTSACGFKFCTILSLICYAVFGLLLLLIYLLSGPAGWIMCIGSVSLIVFALLAICSPRPIYMQLYMIVLAIVHGIYIITAIYSAIDKVIHWDTPVKRDSTHFRIKVGDEQEDHFIQSDKDDLYQPSFGVVLAGAIINLAVLLLLILWYWTIVYSYYSYLRDQLLHKEQHGTTGVVNVDMRGHGGQPQVVVQQAYPGYPNNQPASNPGYNWKAQ